MAAEFDLSTLTTADGYKLLIGAIVPRPIALVTTLSASGVINAAPYSFFNAVSYDPPLVVLGIEARPDRRAKDTVENIREHQEFVVNLVDGAIAERMVVCAGNFPPEVDALEQAGLTSAPARQVAVPRIAEAPVCLECRRYLSLEIGPARNLILGRILHIAVREDAVDQERLYIDQDVLGLIGRLAGAQYSRPGEIFEMPLIDAEAWIKKSK